MLGVFVVFVTLLWIFKRKSYNGPVSAHIEAIPYTTRTLTCHNNSKLSLSRETSQLFPPKLNSILVLVTTKQRLGIWREAQFEDAESSYLGEVI